MDNKALLQERDAKTKPHLEQFGTVWLVDEKLIPEDEAVVFEVVFRHNMYGWVKRRYRYDAFNKVLYYRGQTLMDEETVGDTLSNKDPYIETEVADLTSAYGG